MLFCVKDKFKRAPGKLRARAVPALARPAQGRLRIDRIDVEIPMADRAESLAHLDRYLQQFEDFCIVSPIVRHGIRVEVRVVDTDGRLRHGSSSGAAALSAPPRRGPSQEEPG